MKRKLSESGLQQPASRCRKQHGASANHSPPVSKVDIHVHLALLQYLDCATVPAATRFLRALVQLPALEVTSVRCYLCKTDIALWGWQVRGTHCISICLAHNTLLRKSLNPSAFAAPGVALAWPTPIPSPPCLSTPTPSPQPPGHPLVAWRRCALPRRASSMKQLGFWRQPHLQ